MKSIFVISPDYLDALFDEAEKFSFAIHGYGNPERACKGLMYANVTAILGYAVVYEEMPRTGSTEYRGLIEFIRKCNLLESGKKFVVVCRGPITGLEQVARKFKNLNFSLHPNIEYISDTVINKMIYGSILLDNYEPYILHEKPKAKVGEFSSPTLNFVPIVPSFIPEIFETVHMVDSLEDTLQFDIVWNKYKEQNQLVADFRELLIREKKQEPSDRLLIRIMEQVNRLDAKSRCLYMSCINEIKGRIF